MIFIWVNAGKKTMILFKMPNQHWRLNQATGTTGTSGRNLQQCRCQYLSNPRDEWDQNHYIGTRESLVPFLSHGTLPVPFLLFLHIAPLPA